jgi:hypothetical protein
MRMVRRARDRNGECADARYSAEGLQSGGSSKSHFIETRKPDAEKSECSLEWKSEGWEG